MLLLLLLFSADRQCQIGDSWSTETKQPRQRKAKQSNNLGKYYEPQNIQMHKLEML